MNKSHRKSYSSGEDYIRRSTKTWLDKWKKIVETRQCLHSVYDKMSMIIHSVRKKISFKESHLKAGAIIITTIHFFLMEGIIEAVPFLTCQSWSMKVVVLLKSWCFCFGIKKQEYSSHHYYLRRRNRKIKINFLKMRSKTLKSKNDSRKFSLFSLRLCFQVIHYGLLFYFYFINMQWKIRNAFN